MKGNNNTTAKDASMADQEVNESTETADYDLPVELFAGAVILVMGVLVLVTPLITEMPSDSTWNPVLINLISGGLYVIIGLFALMRSELV